MNQKLRGEAEQIMEYAIGRVLPDAAVARALGACDLSGRIYLAAVGKAAWQMANAAVQYLKTPITDGVVVTKYGHVKGDIPGVRCFEGGHPILDENGQVGTQAILNMTADLTDRDHVLFLVSGGGSALFEKPLVPLPVLQDLNRQLLAAGASIKEINTLRKRLSAVKGGRFAKWCEPAGMDVIILSDVLGDPLDMIASGPAAPDSTTCKDALAMVEKYHLNVTEEVLSCLRRETPKELNYVTSHVIGSVSRLCLAAAEKCRELGYETHILTDRLCCEAREAGSFLASIAAGISGAGASGTAGILGAGASGTAGVSEARASRTAGVLGARASGTTGVSEAEARASRTVGISEAEAGASIAAGISEAESGASMAAGVSGAEARASMAAGISEAEVRASIAAGISEAESGASMATDASSLREGKIVNASSIAAQKGAFVTGIPPESAEKATITDGGTASGKAGRYLGGNSLTSGKRAYIAGGECVVHLRGKGLGGRNQELALAAAEGLAGIPGVAVFSVGSDGTDGPTDAAGGYVDGESLDALEAKGIHIQDALARNDSYHALDAIGGLLKTGPTGTNVNDVSVVLIDR